MRRVHRRELVLAKYNPRQIADGARKKLRANLNSVGLLAPLTLNSTTGILLSGHQRLACLDALEGSDDYMLDVAVVELTEAQERAQNIALNNANLAGDWDMGLLADLLKTPELELDATGFTPLDLALSFDDPELSALFQPNEATASLVGELAGIKADAAEQKKSGKPGSSSTSSSDRADGDDGDPESEPSTGDKARAFRKRGKEIFDSMDDTEVMACVIFKSREERENFMERMGLERDERYVDGSRVVARMSVS